MLEILYEKIYILTLDLCIYAVHIIFFINKSYKALVNDEEICV